MQDKETLIKSMTNLINHISMSKKNQEEIFNSLSRKDFQKIISNLDDPMLKLRNKTTHLIGELLYSNDRLKFKFCEISQVGYNSQRKQPTKIVLNSNMGAILQKHASRLPEIIELLKNSKCNNNSESFFIPESCQTTSRSVHQRALTGSSQCQERSTNYQNSYNYRHQQSTILGRQDFSRILLWFIDLNQRQSHKPLSVQHITKDNLSKFFNVGPQSSQSTSTVGSTISQNFWEIDPNSCLIGFYLPKTDSNSVQNYENAIPAKSPVDINFNKNPQKTNNSSYSGIRTKYKHNLSVSAQLQTPSTMLKYSQNSQSRWPASKMALKQSMEIEEVQKPRHNTSYQGYIYTPAHSNNQTSNNKPPISKPRISLNSTSMNRSYHNTGQKNVNPMSTSFTDSRYIHENNFVNGEKKIIHKEIDRNNQAVRNSQDLFLRLNNPIAYKPISLGVHRGCQTTRQNKGYEFNNSRDIASRHY